jgi:Zn-dependent peptidase ImmA (M78 family)
MSSSKAPVNPVLLKWARTTLKISLPLASKKLGVKENVLQDWEEGTEKPTITQLLKIAEVYQRPFSLFYLPEPPKHFKPLKDFRKFSNYVVSEESEVQIQKEIFQAQQNRENALGLLEILGTTLPEFTLKLSMEDGPSSAGQKLIKFLGINHEEVFEINSGYQALNYWKQLLEEKGIMVYQTTSVPVKAMRGACVAETKVPVVIINSNDSENGRIFTLFHEVVHIAMREDGISNFKFSEKALYDKIETFCNQVAGEILVPSRLLLNHNIVKANANIPQWNEYQISTLANQFCVSKEVIIRRLLTLDKTTEEIYLRLRNIYNNRQKPESSGGNYYRSVIGKTGRLIINLALQSYYQEKISASALYDYIHVKAANLPKLQNFMYGKV